MLVRDLCEKDLEAIKSSADQYILRVIVEDIEKNIMIRKLCIYLGQFRKLSSLYQWADSKDLKEDLKK